MAIQAEELAIPIIDLEPMRSGTPEEARETGKKVYEAFRLVGFAYIKNHGIPQEDVDQAFAWVSVEFDGIILISAVLYDSRLTTMETNQSSKFFALSQADKNLAPHPPEGWYHRGYSGVGREKVVQMVYDRSAIDELRKTPDFKESFEIGREDDKRTPNIWTPESTLPGFRQFMTSFHSVCYSTALDLLRAIELGMDLPTGFLRDYHRKQDNQLRLLHYPPVEAELLRQGNLERIAAHTDFGTMTLLFQDEVGGLEVEDVQVKGKFNQAPYIPGTIVVNIGDFLQRWSNDILKSTLHRVRAPPMVQGMTRARYSMPYFVTADREKTIDCVPGCWSEARPKKYEPIQSGEYIEMRLNATY